MHIGLFRHKLEPKTSLRHWGLGSRLVINGPFLSDSLTRHGWFLKESSREQKCSKVLNWRQVDGLRLEPLYPMLSAHLCCGLSHIDTYIQRDSLKHLDEILAMLPGKYPGFFTTFWAELCVKSRTWPNSDFQWSGHWAVRTRRSSTVSP